jgi:hypothetical protein
MSVTSYAIPSEITRSAAPSSGTSVLPFGKTTLAIAVAGWWMPPSAKVAYASACSSGVTPIRSPPIPSAGMPSNGEVIPSFSAICFTLSGPASRSSWA